MQAVKEARRGQFSEAEELLKQANEEMNTAHGFQTELLNNEAGGESTDISLILIHAQDHLMNALTILDFAEEFIAVYEQLLGTTKNMPSPNRRDDT